MVYTFKSFQKIDLWQVHLQFLAIQMSNPLKYYYIYPGTMSSLAYA